MVESKVKKATNVQFAESQMIEIADCMNRLGFITIADFVKFSCKQMCNMVEVQGAIPYTHKKKVVAKKIE